MKTYECIKKIMVQKYDDDGFILENEFGFVDVGSKWYRDDGYNMIGGEVHLDIVSEEKDFSWIEITKEHLQEYFKEVSNE